MSRATELADELDAMSERITRYTNSPGDGLCAEAAETIRRLDRVNAELVEAILDEAEEWSRYVVEDTAPMTLRKYLERKVAALTSSTGDTQ